MTDGESEQPEPYVVATESVRRRDSAPSGTLSPARLYESRAVYPQHRFEYRTYVPAQYTAGRAVALMVFQDGDLYVGRAGAGFNSLVTLDNLIANGELPMMLALFINPGTPSGRYHHPADRALRSAQYDAFDDRYSRFLLDEAIPDLITHHHDVVTDAGGWALAGHSSGGLAAFTAAWHEPQKFQRVLTHNGSFVNIRGGDAYPSLIRRSERKPLRVSLLSSSADSDNEYGSWFEANAAVAAALEAGGYQYRFRRGRGVHYPPLQAVADYPDALRWLWAGYRLPS